MVRKNNFSEQKGGGRQSEARTNGIEIGRL